MGTKYLPTNRDRKASQRFLKQQRPLPFFQKPADQQPATTGKKRGQANGQQG